jgi:hypothetical protein
MAYIRMKHPSTGATCVLVSEDAFEATWEGLGWEVDDDCPDAFPLIASPITQIRGTAAFLAAKNPILPAGVQAWATNTKSLRVGDGVTHLNDLPEMVARRPKVRAQATNQLTGLTTQVIDILPLPTPVIVEGTPWVGHLHLPTLFGAVEGEILHIEITDLSNVPKSQRDWTVSAASGIDGPDLYERITTPGTHHRKVRLSRLVGSGTWGYGANDNEYVQFLEYAQEL